MFFFFFFQAEDGIRDKLVTGVQTCALPISTNKDGDPVAADALSALDKAAKRGNLYEQHESSSRATEVLSALAGIGALMIASRQGDKAPVTVEARISGLLHSNEERAPAPSRTRVLTVGETDTEAGGTPSGLSTDDHDTRGASQL